ncbi:MAG: hypothetical protein COB61_008430 [Thiotrichales bacterium]|nr:hypothetical protein [Thiotrichales bacterium]
MNSPQYIGKDKPAFIWRVCCLAKTIISPEHIDKLAEPFYRVDSARARQTGGYGLGLYLCRLIVEAHGGELLINSEHGIGTTVNFTLEA